MDILFENVDWLATAVGAGLAYLLGWVWYSPKVFLKPWLEGIGLSMEDMAAPPFTAMVIQALGTFLMAWVIAVMAANALLFAAALMVLTLVVMTFSGGLYSQKTIPAIAIEAGYVVVMAAIMIGAQMVI